MAGYVHGHGHGGAGGKPFEIHDWRRFEYRIIGDMTRQLSALLTCLRAHRNTINVWLICTIANK